MAKRYLCPVREEPAVKPGLPAVEDMRMAALDTALRSGLAVLGPDGRVVLVLLGSDAAEAAEEWEAAGYSVQTVAVDLD